VCEERAVSLFVVPVGRPSPKISLGRVQYTQGQVKGQVRACGFEPAKALVRGLNRYPDRRPSRAV